MQACATGLSGAVIVIAVVALVSEYYGGKS